MIYDALIVGGGPAGITAAIYLKRAGKNVAIIEKFAPGGQLNLLDKIENYPGVGAISGGELALKLYEQAQSFEVPFIFEEAKEYDFHGKVKKVICNKNTYEANNVVLAIGSFTKPLNIEGEERLRGKGVSYCAVCDGNFFRDKTVAVIGNGDEAITDTMYLSRVVQKVYLLCEELRPKKVSVKLIENSKNVEIIQGVKPLRIEGDEKVERLVYSYKNKIKVMNLDAIFIAIGRAPDTDKLKGQLELDERGFVITDEHMRTSCDGIFACGDLRNGALKQVATAVGDGAIAGNEIV